MRGDGVVEIQKWRAGRSRPAVAARRGRCRAGAPRPRRRRRAPAEHRLHPRRRPRIRRPLVLRTSRHRDAQHRPPGEGGRALHGVLFGRQHLLAVARRVDDRTLPAALGRQRGALPRHARRAARERAHHSRAAARRGLSHRHGRQVAPRRHGRVHAPEPRLLRVLRRPPQQRRGELLRLRRPPAASRRRWTRRNSSAATPIARSTSSLVRRAQTNPSSSTSPTTRRTCRSIPSKPSRGARGAAPTATSWRRWTPRSASCWRLAELGIERETLVIFTSDNGPWLVMRDWGGSAGGLRGGRPARSKVGIACRRSRAGRTRFRRGQESAGSPT